MSKKKYVIVYDYIFEGGTQATEFVFELPLKRGPRANPNAGPSGLLVQILKYYLGLGSITEVDSTFDVITETALRRWQDEHREEIYQKAGWTMGQFDNPLGQGSPLGGVRIDLPGEFITEQGQLGEPTYLVMLDRGFMQRAKELLESAEFQRVAGSEMNMAHRAFETNGERQLPPKIVGKFVEYSYVTKIRRPQGRQTSDDHIKSQLGGLFREAVLKVFEFYGKDQTWVVDGAPRTEGLDALYELIGDDGDYERKQYEKIVQYQHRSDKFRQNQKFTFTVKRMSLEEQLNGEEIDVLFGQDLTPGATPIFASVAEIVYPTLRPSSTYSIKISIRRDLFELIRGGRTGRLGGTVNLADPKTYETIADTYEDVAEGFNKAKDFIQNDLKKPFTNKFLREGAGRFKDSVNKWAKGQKRKLEQAGKDALKNAWSKATSGDGGFFGGPGNDAWAASQAADMAAKRMELALTNPVRVEFELSKLVPNIQAVAAKIEAFAPDIQEFRAKNKPAAPPDGPFKQPRDAITPYFNPTSEAERLKKLEVALGGFLGANGYSIIVSPFSSDKIEVFFAPVRKAVPASIPENEELSPNLDGRPKQGPAFGKIVGYRIIKINYLHGSGEVEELTTGIPSFTSEDPFTSPTIMGYFISLDDMASEVATINPCVELISSPAVEFFAKYHWPILSFSFNQKEEALVDIKINFDPGSLLTASQEFEEAAKLIQGNIDSLMASSFFKQKGESIVTADLVPDFGKIPCDIEEMWNQFLNRWNMSFILCDFLKCVPSFGPWNFEFNWKLPKLPKIPSFDPLQFIIPQIKIMIAEMIMAFLCALIKMILDSIRLPDCADLLKFGAMALSEINKKNKDNPFANAQEKASLYEKTADTLNNMGLPPSVLNSESEDSIAALLDQISLVLTPYELCSLLEGQASDEVLVIVLNVVQSTSSSLREVLTTTEDIFMFFETLGQVVDPNMCARIKELEDVIVANELCPPGDDAGGERDIRKLLDDVGASPEEIAAELKKAADRRDIMRDLARKGDLSGLIPSTNYDDLKDAGLPGPYNNPMHDKLVKMAVESLIENIKSYFDIEISSFPNMLMSGEMRLIPVEHPRFNPLDYLMYRFYMKQVQNLQKELTVRKVHKLKACNIDYEDAEPNAENEEKARQFFDELEIPENERQYMRFYVVKAEEKEEDAEGNKFFPDVLIPKKGDDPEELQIEKVQEFGELVEKYVMGYIEKYQERDPNIMGKLKQILDLDQSSLTRVHPGPAFNNIDVFRARELSFRLNTEPSTKELVAASSDSRFAQKYSVGYSDAAFFKTGVKDCYKVTYSNLPSITRNNRDYFGKKYYEELPQEYINFRKTSIDINTTLHDDRLLRPPAFATFMVDKYRTLANNGSTKNSFDKYTAGSDAANHIIPKLQGYVRLTQTAAEQYANRANEDASSPIDAAGSNLPSSFNNKNMNPLYCSISDSINFSLSKQTKRSKYFIYEELLKLKDDISRKYIIDEVNGEPCYRLNEKALDFDKMAAEFLAGYKSEISKEKNNPVDRDFNENGPYEEAMISGLFKVYVGMASLEVLLKSVFLFSNFGAERIFEQKFVMDYILESIKRDFNSSLIEDKTRNRVYSSLRKLTETDDNDEALERMVLRNLKPKIMTDFITRVFENDYSSYKEKFYNDLAKNVKEIPHAMDFPKILVQTLNNDDLRTLGGTIARTGGGGGFDITREKGADTIKARNGIQEAPVSYKLPNLRDKFLVTAATAGYSADNFEEDAEMRAQSADDFEKRVNSGHFWIERFYRINNFEQFFNIYTEIEEQTRFSAVPYYPMQSLGVTAASSVYSEYMSAMDLKRLLIGTTNRKSDEEVLEKMAEEEFAQLREYNFIKHVFVSLLEQYFAAIDVTGRQDSLRRFEVNENGVPLPNNPLKAAKHKESMWQANQPGGHIARLRDQNCLAFKVMYDLGMAKRISSGTNTRKNELGERYQILYTGPKFRPRHRLATGAKDEYLLPLGFPEMERGPGQNVFDTPDQPVLPTTKEHYYPEGTSAHSLKPLEHVGNSYSESGVGTKAYNTNSVKPHLERGTGREYDFVTEFDRAYIDGDVSRKELYDRAFSRISLSYAIYKSYATADEDTRRRRYGPPEGTASPSPPPNEPPGVRYTTNWDRFNSGWEAVYRDRSMPHGIKPGTRGVPTDRTFGESTEDYYWFYQAFGGEDRDGHDPDNSWEDIPLRRRVEIFVDCLIEFAELKSHWPIENKNLNSQTIDEYSRGNRARIRNTSDVASLQQASGQSALAMRQMTRITMDYIQKCSLALEYPHYWWTKTDTNWWDRGRGRGYNHSVSTNPMPFSKGPVYTRRDVAQDLILDHYIARVFRPLAPTTLRDYNSFSSVRGVINVAKIGNAYPNDSALDNRLLQLKRQIYNHLKDNLQIGYRLMLGHKVSREEQVGTGEINPETSTTTPRTETISPEHIYNDFFPNMNLARSAGQNKPAHSFGVENGDRKVFSKKRCFLGHVDREPLQDGTGKLNPKSVFYENALKTASANSMIRGGNPATPTMYLLNDKIREKLVYSIPIAEHIEPIDCFEQLLREETGISSRNSFLQGTNRVGDRIKINGFFKEGLFEQYEDCLLENLLSLEINPEKEQGTKTSEKFWRIKANDNTEEELMKPHRMMFDFLFPLDRYVAMHMLQSVLVFDSEQQTQDLLTATKLFIVQNIVLMNDIVESTGMTVPKDAMGTMNDNMGGGEPGIGDIWKMIWKQLAKMIPQAAFAAIRQIADTSDPGYKDMKEQYMNDPCSMKSGLKLDLLGPPMRAGFKPKYDGNRLHNGFGKRGSEGCKTYVPATMFPLDIIFSIALTPWPPFINFPKTARNMKDPIEHFINLFPLPGVPIEMDKSKRYGQFMGPAGLLALSVGELSGEEHARLKREGGCEEGPCEERPQDETPPDDPMRMCEDLEEGGG